MALDSTTTHFTIDKCVHEMFVEQVEKTPEATAITFEDDYISYQDLHYKTNQLAHYLRSQGVASETLVGVCVERSINMVIVLLGILKAGGAYIPLDPAFPDERLNFFLDDAQIQIIVTDESFVGKFNNHQRQVICIDAQWDIVSRMMNTTPTNVNTVNDLVYIIYTSGSTGIPKGVEITHFAIVNFLESMKNEPGLTQQDVLLSVTTISFDIAGLELYLPLIVGAKIVLSSQAVAHDGAQLLKLLSETHATMMQATPTTWQLLIEAGWHGSEHLKVLCGGERLIRTLAEQLIIRCASLWNLYGPTETTIWSTLYHVEKIEGDRPIPIGRPIANTFIYILDSHLQPVPIGIVGELYIGGNGLARGYHNRPDQTEKKFICNPFATNAEARIYRTGDLVRYISNGNIEFVGRNDDQIKIHGFRIELGEIEATLMQIINVKNAVVIQHKKSPGNDCLVAYILSGDDNELTISSIREFLRQKLPPYMIPLIFMILHSFPLTLSGKVDRNMLVRLNPVNVVSDRPFTAPRNNIERTLAVIWSSILGEERLGIYDNFFELGGDSLLVLRVVNMALQKNLKITPKDMFLYQTVAELSNVIGTISIK